MKKGLLFGVLCLWLVGVRASHITIGAIYTIHSYNQDYSSDTVSLVLKEVILPNWGNIGSINKLLADTIRLEVCYSLGNATQPYPTTDTIPLGVFGGGVYNINLTVGIAYNYPFNLCDSSSNDSFNFSFPVYSITSDKTQSSVGEIKLRITPNPATTTLTLYSKTNLPASTSFHLIDLTGRMVLQQVLSEQTQRIEIDISPLPRGLYFLAIKDGQQRTVRKFVKE